MKTLLLIAGVFCASCLLLDSALAQVWQWNSINTNQFGAHNWCTIAMSADGKIMYLEDAADSGGIYFSTNSGSTWSIRSSPQLLVPSLAVSADGSKLFAVSQSGDGQVYSTTNFGLNWMTNSILGLNTGTNTKYVSYLTSIATSADGTKWAVMTATNWVYVTADSGMTWTSNSLPNATGQSLSLRCSADGTKLVVAGTLGLVWVSTNSGAAWTTPANAPIAPWQGMASSSDGSKVFLVGSTNFMYRSIDYGFTWQSNSVPGVTNWNGIASSADGTKLAAVAGGPYVGEFGVGIFISTNGGNTWAQDTNQLFATVPGYSEGLIGGQVGIVSSADGAKLVLIPGIFYYTESSVVTYEDVPTDLVFTSYTPPSPRLQLQLSAPGTNLMLSWPASATNFVLQQNGDMTTTNWTTMTIAVALNYSNLQYEASFSPTNGSGFFRLATP